MKKFLFWLALPGWTLAVIVHVLSIAGMDLNEKIPFIWSLHIGIFVVWIPTIFSLRKGEEFKQFQKSSLLTRMNPLSLFKAIFKTTPHWLTAIAVIGFFYAIINFLLFALSQPAVPDAHNGQYFLENHGQIIRTLTEQEYHHYQANQLRAFSGHWIAFYGAAMAVLFPFKVNPKEYQIVYRNVTAQMSDGLGIILLITSCEK